MLRGANQDQSVLPERGESNLGSLTRVGDNTQIDIAATDLFVDFVDAGILQVDIDIGKSLQVALEWRRELIESDTIHPWQPAPCPQPSGRGSGYRLRFHDTSVQSPCRPHTRPDRLVSGAHCPSSVQPVLGRSAPPVANLLTDRRLGNKILGGGQRKTAGLSQITKNLERFNMHGC